MLESTVYDAAFPIHSIQTVTESSLHERWLIRGAVLSYRRSAFWFASRR